MNPDGRFNGQRANQNGFDMNRDWLVQSQPEVRANLKPAGPVARAGHVRDPRLREPDTRRRPDQAPQPRPRVRRLRSTGTSDGSTRTRLRSPASGRASPGRSTARCRSPSTSGRRSRRRRRRGPPRPSPPRRPTASRSGRRSRSPESRDAGYNGTFTVLTLTDTTFTYTTPGSDLPASSGGTADRPEHDHRPAATARTASRRVRQAMSAATGPSPPARPG